MRDEGQAYYVGLLKAAELHGATHHAVMEFQVMSAKRLPKIRAGRNLIVFYFRKNLEMVTAGTEDRKTDTGTMKISSAALTDVAGARIVALDRARPAGGTGPRVRA